MDSPTLLTAVLLGIVEGLTEFLPVSSTGHLIVAGSLLGYTGDQRQGVRDLHPVGRDAGDRAGNTGARFAGVIAGLGHDPAAQPLRAEPRRRVRARRPRSASRWARRSRRALFAPVPVAVAFIVGAFVILWVEARQRARPASVRVAERRRHDDWLDASVVGRHRAGLVADPWCITCRRHDHRRHVLPAWIGQSSTQFSFYLSIPTLFAAGAYSMWKSRALLDVGDLPVFGVGFVAAFIAAFVCVRWLIRYVAHHDFVPFAWYRIAFGAIVLITAWTGIVQWQ